MSFHSKFMEYLHVITDIFAENSVSFNFSFYKTACALSVSANKIQLVKEEKQK